MQIKLSGMREVEMAGEILARIEGGAAGLQGKVLSFDPRDGDVLAAAAAECEQHCRFLGKLKSSDAAWAVRTKVADACKQGGPGRSRRDAR